MIIFIYGNDSYRIRRATERAIYEFTKEKPYPTYSLRSAEEFSTCEQLVKHRSLFDAGSVVEIRNTSFVPLVIDRMIALIEDTDVATRIDTLLIIREDQKGKDLKAASKKLFHLCEKKSAQMLAYEDPKPRDQVAFVIEEGKIRNVDFSPDIAQLIIDTVGSDSQLLVQEVDKISAYKRRGRVTESDVSQLVSGSEEVNVFHLSDAILARDKNRAFALLFQALAFQGDPYRLLAPIVYQFRTMIIVASGTQQGIASSDIARIARIHPFVVQKTVSAIQKFPASYLHDAYRRLYELDVRIKSGVSDPVNALFGFLLAL